ncbi:hypothetical protein AYI69_g4628 [Smittium culicis]|uniref:Uncharacterized protein n=1 Tax=Smittium culicis TaxID=133412 RepID=A0A1R1YC17_9FUNG|nr:hypothetical protein AYI69_g4628 [Smittium culicis]
MCERTIESIPKDRNKRYTMDIIKEYELELQREMLDKSINDINLPRMIDHKEYKSTGNLKSFYKNYEVKSVIRKYKYNRKLI